MIFPSMIFQSKTFGLIILLLMASVAGCSRSDSKESKDSDDVVTGSGGSNIYEYKYSELHRVEDFELIERDGSKFGTKDLKGKVWVASFFFSTCKFECSDQNNTIRDEIHEKLTGDDFLVVSITCDPITDTADVLNNYATQFTTKPKAWKFLTGPLADIQAIGDKSFKVIVDPKSHSKRVLMVDKWGRFRDSFEWKEPKDLIRLRKTAKMLAAEETEPKPDDIVKTRALPESVFQLKTKPTSPHSDGKSENEKVSKRDPSWPKWRNEEWLTSFELKNSAGESFHSDDMKGKVWISNFFFTGCTTACPRLLQTVDELRQQLGDRKVTFVSISNDPDRDTPKVLREYRLKFKDAKNWHFLTGEEQLQMRAIGAEFFNVDAGKGETHSEELTIVDKWGKVRGHFRYNKTDEMTALRLLIDDLLAEKEPPKKR